MGPTSHGVSGGLNEQVSVGAWPGVGDTAALLLVFGTVAHGS